MFPVALVLQNTVIVPVCTQPLAHFLKAEQADRILPSLPSRVIRFGQRLTLKAVKKFHCHFARDDTIEGQAREPSQQIPAHKSVDVLIGTGFQKRAGIAITH